MARSSPTSISPARETPTLATTYEIDGATLIQTVDTSDAVYPIVADPRVESHW